MSKVLSSIGVEFLIAKATTYGTRPQTATDYTKIPQIIENSEFDLDPDTIDTTSYDNLKYKSSIAGLIDASGIQTLTANATAEEDAETVWDSMVDEYENGSQIWLCVVIPEKEDATYIPIAPVRTGAYTTTVNDRITIKLKFTITGDMEFGLKPQ